MRRAVILATVVEGISVALLAISYLVGWPSLSVGAVVLNYPVLVVCAVNRELRHADMSLWQGLVFTGLAQWLVWFLVFRFAFMLRDSWKRGGAKHDA